MSIRKSMMGFFGVLLLASCSGSEKVADLVQVRQAGDEQRSCQVLVAEMNGISEAITRRDERSAITPGNILAGESGVGVDIKNFRLTDKASATEEEIEALRKRYEYLDLVARRKLCYQ